jgi:3-deoxy-D-manno-octulosonic acid (KDO) 8-phosphate synthase
MTVTPKSASYVVDYLMSSTEMQVVDVMTGRKFVVVVDSTHDVQQGDLVRLSVERIFRAGDPEQ